MATIFSTLTFLSFFLLIIGFIKPSVSLFWYKKNRTRKKSSIIYGSVFILGLTLSALFGASEYEKVNKVELTQIQKDSIKVADSLANVEKLAQNRKAEIEKQFNSWDGSHMNLEKYIKDNMNDPNSYEHVETRYFDMKNHLVVITKFRGKNTFGGKIINTVKAEVDMQGNVTKIIEQF